MSATEIDSLWFHSHPDRQFRLRRQTPAETSQWPVPPQEGFTGWCIIRRNDGLVRAFALAAGVVWDDYDEEIAPFFDELGERE